MQMGQKNLALIAAVARQDIFTEEDQDNCLDQEHNSQQDRNGLLPFQLVLRAEPVQRPSSIITNKKSTMIAPAYTVTCARAINGAPSIR